MYSFSSFVQSDLKLNCFHILLYGQLKDILHLLILIASLFYYIFIKLNT